MTYTGYHSIAICYSFMSWVFTTWNYYMGKQHRKGFRVFGHEWEEVKELIWNV